MRKISKACFATRTPLSEIKFHSAIKKILHFIKGNKRTALLYILYQILVGFGLISLFKEISTFVSYSLPKKNSYGTI